MASREEYQMMKKILENRKIEPQASSLTIDEINGMEAI
tara:strand:- start:293 stop:406 length:114 start_codon:yes stop_codon:yes gene_type:complete